MANAFFYVLYLYYMRNMLERVISRQILPQKRAHEPFGFFFLTFDFRYLHSTLILKFFRTLVILKKRSEHFSMISSKYFLTRKSSVFQHAQNRCAE